MRATQLGANNVQTPLSSTVECLGRIMSARINQNPSETAGNRAKKRSTANSDRPPLQAIKLPTEILSQRSFDLDDLITRATTTAAAGGPAPAIISQRRAQKSFEELLISRKPSVEQTGYNIPINQISSNPMTTPMQPIRAGTADGYLGNSRSQSTSRNQKQQYLQLNYNNNNNKQTPVEQELKEKKMNRVISQKKAEKEVLPSRIVSQKYRSTSLADYDWVNAPRKDVQTQEVSKETSSTRVLATPMSKIRIIPTVIATTSRNSQEGSPQQKLHHNEFESQQIPKTFTFLQPRLSIIGKQGMFINTEQDFRIDSQQSASGTNHIHNQQPSQTGFLSTTSNNRKLSSNNINRINATPQSRMAASAATATPSIINRDSPRKFLRPSTCTSAAAGKRPNSSFSVKSVEQLNVSPKRPSSGLVSDFRKLRQPEAIQRQAFYGMNETEEKVEQNNITHDESKVIQTGAYENNYLFICVYLLGGKKEELLNSLDAFDRKLKQQRRPVSSQVFNFEEQCIKPGRTRKGFCGISQIENQILSSRDGARRVREKKAHEEYPYCLSYDPF